MSRRYSSMAAFHRDQPEMAALGWTLQAINVADRAGGLLGFIPFGNRQDVDAHYLRPEAPV